jgi:hypothetical protein
MRSFTRRRTGAPYEFLWILEVLGDQGLVKGKTVGIDRTALEANAAMRSIHDGLHTRVAGDQQGHRSKLVRRFGWEDAAEFGGSRFTK